ncbi:MAG TPA: hypothetical protein VGJ48_11110 [Pyrinomonadaceae bacterium]|jgi:hypothetical protein
MKSRNGFRKTLMFSFLTGALSLTYVISTAAGTAKAENPDSTVPLKAQDAGTWGVGSHECGTSLPVVVETTGTATHLGHYTYASQECADLAAMTYQGEFTIRAADGATLFGTYEGTFDFDEDGNIVYHQTNTISGGTGRLTDASGLFTVSGIADTSSFADEQVLLGFISLH